MKVDLSLELDVTQILSALWFIQPDILNEVMEDNVECLERSAAVPEENSENFSEQKALTCSKGLLEWELQQ